MTQMKTISQIYGEWTTVWTTENVEQSRVFFLCTDRYKNTVNLNVVSILATKSNSYSSIEDLIESLPLYDDDTNELSRYIAQDSARGFGTDFPELGVVAYVGQSHMDRPVAKIRRKDGSDVFVPHPQINNLVKRYR
jgi:hypothetical protein